MNSPVCVNVKVKYIRPKYDNLKDWCEDDNNVYCGRRGVVFITDDNGVKSRYPKSDSKYCNPYKINKNNDREQVLKKYEIYARKKFSKEDILSLENKNLGCWCKPLDCHCDILIKLYKEMVIKEKKI